MELGSGRANLSALQDKRSILRCILALNGHFQGQNHPFKKKRILKSARAKRHCIPGQIWHLTHRCHKREFLLRFGRDRRRWSEWLFQAEKRYGLRILNYMVTSNHIHLLVLDDGGRDVIPNSIKLIAGRTGQEYNQRKNRKGAFWEDRYHATGIQKKVDF